MRAIIFAAGLASRLGDLTRNLPKACLTLNDQETILERSLSLIHDNGFDEVIIVTGHAEEAIKQISSKWTKRFKKIKTVFNPEYATRNNIYSAYLIRDLLDGSSFIFNSDIVYHQYILENAMFAYNTGLQSFLVIDDQKPLVDEDMKVTLNDKANITRINKALNNETSQGEYIGILYLNTADAPKFKDSLEAMIEAKEYSKYYEDALDRIAEDLELKLVSTEGREWTEIDTIEDYNRARNLECAKSPYQNSYR